MVTASSWRDIRARKRIEFPVNEANVFTAHLLFHKLRIDEATILNHFMEGYAKVAQLMGTHPEFAIFRRFRELNMQDMLYLQAEITYLEADLRKVAREDVQHGNRENHPYDWWSMAHGQGEGDTKQWGIVREIREKLEKYSKLWFSLSTLPYL